LSDCLFSAVFPNRFSGRKIAFRPAGNDCAASNSSGDIRDITRIQDIGQLETLMQSLGQQAGQLVNYTTLANRINTSVDTIRRWLGALQSFTSALRCAPGRAMLRNRFRKQPKLYLWDWSLVTAEGGRALKI